MFKLLFSSKSSARDSVTCNSAFCIIVSSQRIPSPTTFKCNWGTAKGFKLFPREGFGSVTLNCFANTLGYDLPALNKILKAKHSLVIDGGYGKLKGQTFRISNMGDETDATIASLLQSLDAALAETPKLAK